MLDYTDLQLMACEQIQHMEPEELIEFIGADLEYDDEEAAEKVFIGDLESLTLEDPDHFKKWLGFMLYAVGERIPSTLGKEGFRTEAREDSKK